MKNNLIFVFIILLIIGFLFYWFQIRPSEIRSECAVITEEELVTKGTKTAKEWLMWRELYYTSCLNGKGL